MTQHPPSLAIVGNLNIDLLVGPVERMPRPDEELIVESARIEMAGTAGYALLAASALGIEPVVVSTIGDDDLGRQISASMARLGVASSGVEALTGEETPLSMVFVASDGSRSILSTLGAHKHMSMDVVERHDAAIARCDDVFLCGSYLLPRLGPADVISYAHEARQRGQGVIFDPSWDPSGWGERTRRDTLDLLGAVDVYMPNEAELTHLTATADWREAATQVATLAGEVVVKRGADGSTWVCGDGWIDVPGFEIEAHNTIGAGDVFDVGYFFTRRMDWPPRRRLEFAGALAAMVVSQVESRIYPNVDAVLAFLRGRLGNRVWGESGPR